MDVYTTAGLAYYLHAPQISGLLFEVLRISESDSRLNFGSRKHVAIILAVRSRYSIVFASPTDRPTRLVAMLLDFESIGPDRPTRRAERGERNMGRNDPTDRPSARSVAKKLCVRTTRPTLRAERRNKNVGRNDPTDRPSARSAAGGRNGSEQPDPRVRGARQKNGDETCTWRDRERTSSVHRSEDGLMTKYIPSIDDESRDVWSGQENNNKKHARTH